MLCLILNRSHLPDQELYRHTGPIQDYQLFLNNEELTKKVVKTLCMTTVKKNSQQQDCVTIFENKS